MTAAAKLATRTTRTVLVADDTEFVRDRFKTAIEAAGHNALTARTGQEVLAAVRANASGIDLIVVDLRLPQVSGVTLVSAIRQLDQRLRIVVFSGTIRNADEVRQLETLGVVGYVNEYTAVQHILPSLRPHLFPDRADRRSSPRVVLGIPVSYRFGNTIAAALTINISHSGLAIRTTTPLAVGTPVKVRFRLPGGKNEIEVDARVSWSDRRLGMGIQFKKVPASDQAQIDQYVHSHFFSNRRA
jgi:uncharacterized protein (TIGR02266 family)